MKKFVCSVQAIRFVSHSVHADFSI